MKTTIGIAVTLLVLGTSLSARAQQVPVSEPTQNPNAVFRVYRTQNVYMTLELNTETGQIWEVQWSADDSKRFKLPLFKGFTDQSHPGRFTLTPTSNVFNFILVDQDKGDVWQVQWGTNPLFLRIPAAPTS